MLTNAAENAEMYAAMIDEAECHDILDLPLWHEGMLLAPQHLQQQALAIDRAVRFRFAASDTYGFGVVTLDIDQGALVSGIFRVTRCTAVMPDGLLVQIPQRDARPLEFDLDSYLERLRVQPLRIEMAVPREAEGGAHINAERFRAFEGHEEMDINAGSGRVQVPRQIPNVSLRIGDRPTTKFTTVPLAEVTLRDEALSLTDYVPPRLVLPEDNVLTRELSGLARRVREKAVYLSERARSYRTRASHDAAEDLRLPLKALCEHLPEFEALLSSGNGHPFDVYLHLCRMAGCMTALSNFAVPPQGRGYRHSDIRRSYRQQMEFVHRCLDQIRQDFTVIGFEQTEGGFQLDLKTQKPQQELIVAAQVAPGVSAAATWDWLEDSLIADPERLDDLRRRRTLGASRRLLERDEAVSYTLAADTVLFAVRLDTPHVGSDDVLAIVNASPEKTEERPIQLYAYVAGEDESGGSAGGGAS